MRAGGEHLTEPHCARLLACMPGCLLRVAWKAPASRAPGKVRAKLFITKLYKHGRLGPRLRDFRPLPWRARHTAAMSAGRRRMT